MATKREPGLIPAGTGRDPFALLRQMSADMERMFEDAAWPSFRWSSRRERPQVEAVSWFPQIDVFEKDNRIVTKIDLPGMKKEDVNVEVSDGHLTISGERRSEAEEKKDSYFRSERSYGSFYRAVPLPEGVKLDDVKATFADGVLEISVPIPAEPEAKKVRVDIQDSAASAKPAA